jgi:hypothetical protein
MHVLLLVSGLLLNLISGIYDKLHVRSTYLSRWAFGKTQDVTWPKRRETLIIPIPSTYQSKVPYILTYEHKYNTSKKGGGANPERIKKRALWLIDTDLSRSSLELERPGLYPN